MNKFVVIAKKASFWEVVDGKQKRISKARFDAILTQKIVKVEYHETETVYRVDEREEVELFSFAELSEVAQERIIEENRYLLVDDENWFEHLKEDFHETLDLLGFSNIHSGFGSQGVSFTAEWDARNIVTDDEKWKSDKEYKYFKPFTLIMGKLGSKAKIYRVAERCYINADDVRDEPVLKELYNNICNKYYNKLLKEYNYLISDDALRDYYLNCDWLKYTKKGVCVND